MWPDLLAQVGTSEMTNADAWQRTIALLFGTGGILTVLATAAGYVWKKNADRRFEAEEEGRKAVQRTQEDATKAQRELIDYLKEQVASTKATTEANTHSLQTQTLSLQTQTDVLQKMSEKQTEHIEVSKKTHDAMMEAVKDPKRVCRAPKTSRRKTATQL